MKFSFAANMLALSAAAVSVSAFAPVNSRGAAFSSTQSSTTSTTSKTSLSATGVARNPNFAKLAGGYLFPEIGRRRTAYLEEHPEHKTTLISLGIGDTTQPIPKHILAGLVEGASRLGVKETYSGYGDGQGQLDLREKIADKLYKGIIDASEVFVSDGAKCDIMRLQQMFGAEVVSAVQDPSYPVYVDTSVMMGQTGGVNAETSQYNDVVYMKCNPENGFFPDYAAQPRADVVYVCSPNNPTGVTATMEQLTDLVALCKERGSILVFDAAYAPFIRTPGVPKSIFEVPGAKDCSIEVNSFSKYAGFTGVRLGWTVVPTGLKYADGTPVAQDYNRVLNTAFNGASNIVQHGALSCLDDQGLAEIDVLIDYYMENARILRETMEGIGFDVYGGIDAPYVFVKLPDSMGGSWQAFQTILEKTQVVTIPGAGFGPGGEGYLRLSAFAPRESVVEACARLTKALAPVKA